MNGKIGSNYLTYLAINYCYYLKMSRVKEGKRVALLVTAAVTIGGLGMMIQNRISISVNQNFEPKTTFVDFGYSDSVTETRWTLTFESRPELGNYRVCLSERGIAEVKPIKMRCLPEY